MTTANRLRLAPLLVAWGLTPGPSAPGQEPVRPASKAAEDGKGKWLPVFRKHADDFAVTAAARGEAVARLPDPLLRWWQPVRGGDDGALYLWVDSKGRPVAAVTFFTFAWPNGGERVISHERHSFAPGPIEATWRGKDDWHPTAPGLTFRPVPDAPPPAESAPARLRQMQALVRDVVATTQDKGRDWTLRALNRPLHRYEAPDQGLVDGALFALAQGTDPEAFLVLEARGSGKDARWESAVARFTDLPVRVESKGRELFSGPGGLGKPDGIYYVNVAVSKKGDSPDDFR